MYKTNTKDYRPLVIAPEDRKQWRKERGKSLGGSDIGAIIGVNPYKSLHRIWLEKTGRIEQAEENDFMESGHYEEDAIAKRWCNKTGNRLIKSSDEDVIYVHPEKNYIRATPDRRYVNKTVEGFTGKGVIEAKESARKIEEASEWYCQLQWYLGIIGLKGGTIVVKNPFDRRLYWKTYLFNSEFFQYLINEADKFWNYNVLTDVEPFEKSMEEVKEIFPNSDKDKIVKATDFVLEDAEKLSDVRAKKKELEKQEKRLKSRITSFMQDAEKLTDPSGNLLASFQNVKGSEKFDVDSFKKQYPELYEQFKVKKPGYRKFMPKV